MVAILLGSPVAIFGVHAVLCRLSRGASPQRTCVRAAALALLPVGFAALLLGGPASGADRAWAAAYCGLTYVSIAYSYFHLFNMSETARRIRLLRELLRQGPLGSEQLLSLYRGEEIMSRRIERLLESSQLTEQSGRYLVRSRLLLRAARMVAGWRRLLGFDRPHG
jgi:hypothetical protein